MRDVGTDRNLGPPQPPVSLQGCVNLVWSVSSHNPRTLNDISQPAWQIGPKDRPVSGPRMSTSGQVSPTVKTAGVKDP